MLVEETLEIEDEIEPECSGIIMRKGGSTSLCDFYIQYRNNIGNNWHIIIIAFVFMISRSNKIIVTVEGRHFTDAGRY